MPDKPWKVMERRVAAKLGGKRNPFSGAVPDVTAGDVIHEELYIECKHGKNVPLLKLMHKTEEAARREGKIPVLALHKKGENHDYFLVRDDCLKTVAEFR